MKLFKYESRLHLILNYAKEKSNYFFGSDRCFSLVIIIIIIRPWFSFFQTILLHLARMVTQHDSLTNVQRVVTKMMTFQFNKKERVSFDIEEKNKTVAFVRTPVQEEAPWGYVSHTPSNLNFFGIFQSR